MANQRSHDREQRRCAALAVEIVDKVMADAHRPSLTFTYERTGWRGWLNRLRRRKPMTVCYHHYNGITIIRGDK